MQTWYNPSTGQVRITSQAPGAGWQQFDGDKEEGYYLDGKPISSTQAATIRQAAATESNRINSILNSYNLNPRATQGDAVQLASRVRELIGTGATDAQIKAFVDQSRSAPTYSTAYQGGGVQNPISPIPSAQDVIGMASGTQTPYVSDKYTDGTLGDPLRANQTTGGLEFIEGNQMTANAPSNFTSPVAVGNTTYIPGTPAPAPAPSTTTSEGVTAPVVGPDGQTVVPGGGPGNDPYSSFKVAYRTALGRDVTQDEMNSTEFLSQLDNSLLRLIPADRLRSFSLDRLAKLDNSDLMRLGDDIVAQLPNDRLKTFPSEVQSRVVTDPKRRAELGLQGAAGASQPPAGSNNQPAPATANPNPVVGPGPQTDGGSAPGFVFNPQMRQGSAQSLIQGGFQGGPTSELDIKRLMPFATDPEFASRNLLRGYGFNVDSDNPFVNFMQGVTPDLVERTRMRNVLAGKSGGEQQTLGDIQGVLGSGRTQGGIDFITGLRDLQAKYMANPESLGAEQRGLAEKLNDPDEAFRMFNMGQDLSPDLMTPAVQRNIKMRMMDRFKNQAGAGQGTSFLDFLSGKRMGG